ncbi:hypothetical protein SETIT_4G234600v2 [Setaria italica]|uniref:Uncharacterized protein n=1 Tax=Setaria italica TaxID=4555 RepID=A0A368QXE2_SETIT|nr:hypothetical protein SETIT_4G234600v2 [Setaria italica]
MPPELAHTAIDARRVEPMDWRHGWPRVLWPGVPGVPWDWPIAQFISPAPFPFYVDHLAAFSPRLPAIWRPRRRTFGFLRADGGGRAPSSPPRVAVVAAERWLVCSI